MGRERYVDAPSLALVYTGLGDTAHAVDWLERAVADRACPSGCSKWYRCGIACAMTGASAGSLNSFALLPDGLLFAQRNVS